MKATVDKDGCISCGLCASTCPQVFALDENEIAEVICGEIPESAQEEAMEARDGCPVSVISIEG